MDDLLTQLDQGGFGLRLKLENTVPIESIQEPKVKEVLERLKKHHDEAHQVLGVVINAIVTEKKAAFLFSKQIFWDLILSNPDIKGLYKDRGASARTSLYKGVTRLLDNKGKPGSFVRIAVPSRAHKPNAPAVMEVVNPELLHEIGGANPDLLQECCEFVQPKDEELIAAQEAAEEEALSWFGE